jgi:Holliday junction resolvasome RuvABC ATP-dependent DNA helicase subunit
VHAALFVQAALKSMRVPHATILTGQAGLGKTCAAGCDFNFSVRNVDASSIELR